MCDRTATSSGSTVCGACGAQNASSTAVQCDVCRTAVKTSEVVKCAECEAAIRPPVESDACEEAAATSSDGVDCDVYDPSFLLPLLSHLMDPGRREREGGREGGGRREGGREKAGRLSYSSFFFSSTSSLPCSCSH